MKKEYVNRKQKIIWIIAIVFLTWFGLHEYGKYLVAIEEANKEYGTDVVEIYEGPIVGYIHHYYEREIAIVVRDVESGKLGYGYFTESDLENQLFEEVAEIIRNEEYGTMVGIHMEYSSELAEKDGYENGYPIVSAWVYKGELIDRDFSGVLVAYLDNEDGKILVMKNDADNEIVFVQITENCKLNDKLMKIIEEETCYVGITVRCQYYEYVNYEAYPAMSIELK